MDCTCQAILSITNSWCFLKLMSIKLVMPSNLLILCHPLFLLPSIFPSIRVFPNESVLHIRRHFCLYKQEFCSGHKIHHCLSFPSHVLSVFYLSPGVLSVTISVTRLFLSKLWMPANNPSQRKVTNRSHCHQGNEGTLSKNNEVSPYLHSQLSTRLALLHQGLMGTELCPPRTLMWSPSPKYDCFQR